MPTDGTDVKVLWMFTWLLIDAYAMLSCFLMFWCVIFFFFPVWCLVSGVHSGPRLRSCRSQEVSSSGWEGREGQRREGDPLPCDVDSHGETGGPQGLPGLQGKVESPQSVVDKPEKAHKTFSAE